ncbi:hypothetical protein [Thiomicrorhabdus indica]|uniref:hypothetical protein n=1 Tax=Thiomicrorhabdus indica TaxID=2267253 RepID=UPI00102DA275|nr:hypothetical protein [Thiomicrorhabdus indica]
MDIFTRIFLFGGALLGAIMLIAALFALSTAENGVLTVENLEQLEPQFTSLYNLLQFFIYPWLAVGAFLLFRFLKRVFSR